MQTQSGALVLTNRHWSVRLGAAQVELGLAVRRQGTPVLLVSRGAVITDRVGLPSLVKRLEVEGVDAPLQNTAHGFLVVRLVLY